MGRHAAVKHQRQWPAQLTPCWLYLLAMTATTAPVGV